MSTTTNAITIATTGGEPNRQILLRMANRHGLVTGATGTGKTVTLQRMTEEFSRAGVPVFLADVKGDLAGLARPGVVSERLSARLTACGNLPFEPRAIPTVFWDLYGAKGHPIRTTLTEMGPLLLARLLQLTPAQEGVLMTAFRIADDNQWLLLDLKDLRAILSWIDENIDTVRPAYGTVSKQSAGVLLRNLLALEDAGAEVFFGEPAFRLPDFFRFDSEGHGYVHILDASVLIHNPSLYTTLLLFILSELFEELPEVGDPEKPKLVFFFDEAHLLFSDAPKILLERIEQVVRLIRSKGVGVYFVTQSPLDVPDSVLGQLGNRVQHALRAFTPRDQKAVRAAAETFRTNPKLDTAEVITHLEVGEALVSFLDDRGAPTIVERSLVIPPSSRLGPITEAERKELLASSPLRGVYDTAVDRDSAYEILKKAAAGKLESADKEEVEAPIKKERGSKASQPKPMLEGFFSSALKSFGTQFGREIMRGILGSFSTRRR